MSDNDLLATNQQEFANIFNNFYVEVCPKLASTIPYCDTKTFTMDHPNTQFQTPPGVEGILPLCSSFPGTISS